MQRRRWRAAHGKQKSAIPASRQARGEAELDGHPANGRPAERACQGWHAPDFLALQDSKATEGLARFSGANPPAGLTCSVSPTSYLAALNTSHHPVLANSYFKPGVTAKTAVRAGTRRPKRSGSETLTHLLCLLLHSLC